MSATSENTVTINLPQLEALVRRLVREAVREELKRVFSTRLRELIEEWEHEGVDEPGDDEKLLADALEVIKCYGDDHSKYITLEELEAELAAEASEMPRHAHPGSAERCL